MLVKIVNNRTAFPSGTKRFYMPASLEAFCPVCGDLVERDFQSEYLSYPVLNEKLDVVLVCKRDHEFQVSVRVAVTLEPAP